MRLRLRLLCLLALAASSAPPTAAAQRPNFVLVIADDMGWDEAVPYGHPTIRTPNLARLAREGLRFDRAFVTTSSCSPSRASIITGRYPHATGAEVLHTPVPASQITFVERLRAAGYWTAAVGKWHLGDALLGRFDVVKDAAKRNAGASATMPGGGDLSGAEEWLATLRERPRDRPFLLWLAAFDPHRDYVPGAIARPHRPEEVVVPPYLPDAPEVRADLAHYYDEIARLDGYVGQVLDELARQHVDGNTVVVFLSDNGMPFPRAKTTLYDSGIHTPLLVRWPRVVRPGGVSARLVSTVDLAPTFLELAGVPRPPTVQGVSLVPLLRDPGGARGTREYVFAEKNWHDFYDRSRAVRSERYKLVRNTYGDIPNTPPADAVRSPTFQVMRRLRDAGRLTAAQRVPFALPRPAEELYDTWADPHELHDLARDPRYAAVRAALERALDAWTRETGDRAPASRTPPDAFDRETGEPLPQRLAPPGRR
jgi:arylsulfatase A-like enzyme